MAKKGRKKGTVPVGRQIETLFKPGVSGNKSGRSSAHQRLQVALEETMQKFLEQDIEVSVNNKKIKMTRLQALLQKLFKEAMEGKAVVPAVSEIFDRGFGKAKQAIEHTGMAPVTVVDSIPDYELPAPEQPAEEKDGPPVSTDKPDDDNAG